MVAFVYGVGDLLGPVGNLFGVLLGGASGQFVCDRRNGPFVVVLCAHLAVSCPLCVALLLPSVSCHAVVVFYPRVDVPGVLGQALAHE